MVPIVARQVWVEREVDWRTPRSLGGHGDVLIQGVRRAEGVDGAPALVTGPVLRGKAGLAGGVRRSRLSSKE